MSDTDRVAVLLAESLSAHKTALALRRQKKLSEARETLQRAATARRTAHELDPGHTAPAWDAEQGETPNGRDTHTAMLAFYLEQGV